MGVPVSVWLSFRLCLSISLVVRRNHSFTAHVVVPSLCIRRDGRGGALDLRPVFTKEFIYRQGQKFRDIFRIHLEHDLKKYGVQLKDIPLKHGTSFRIDEIPDSSLSGVE